VERDMISKLRKDGGSKGKKRVKGETQKVMPTATNPMVKQNVFKSTASIHHRLETIRFVVVCFGVWLFT
jgi:hypothetical protein